MSDSEMMRSIVHSDGSVTLFQCEVCQKLFNKKQTLRQHFITHTDRFACKFCDARCKSKGDLRTHIQTHTKEKPYHCDVCNTNYTRESILKKHLSTQIHLKAVYERESLNRPRSSGSEKGRRPVKQFTASRAKVRIGGFECQRCSKVMLTRKDYKKHIKSHTLTHVCNICQKGCKTALLLSIHIRSHSSPPGKLTCKTCSRKFSSVQCLKDHVKMHKRTITEPDHSLIRAVINKHNKDIKKPKMSSDVSNEPDSVDLNSYVRKKPSFECEVCHRLFTSEKRLANHSQTHKGPYPCNTCPKSFTTKSKLTTHNNEHEKVELKCETCHISVESGEELRAHMEKSHSEGAELICKICYKKFDSPGELHNHMNDHAPTMLFSGGSLDESTIPVVSRGKKNPFHAFSFKTESDESSDEERKSQVGKDSRFKQSLFDKQGSKLDHDSELTNSEFLEVVGAALNDEEGNCWNGLSDVEDEMFSYIVEVLESEILSPADSEASEEDDDDHVTAMIEKPILYCHGDIVRKHSKVFEQYSLKDPSRSFYQCTLCDVTFDKEKYLNDHLKCHVCEYCNKFFMDKGKLSVHKSRHVKRLLSSIDSQTKYPASSTTGSKSHVLMSSDSEAGQEDQFLNELEDILEGGAAKTSKSSGFLKTLSHDDIVKVNKPMFDQHSFVDLASNIYACTICKRKYARPTTLTRHFKTHVCQYCNMFFVDKSDLLEHKYRHRKRAALIKAEVTGEGSKMPPSPVVSKENRILFKRFSYVDSERNINRCTLCNKDFARRTVLTRHLKTHICGHCDKFFEDKYDLIKHTSHHKVDRLYTEEDGDDEGEDFIEYDEDPKRFPQPSPLTAGIEKTLTMPSSFPSSLVSYSSSFHPQPSCNTRGEPITYIQLPNRGNGAAETAQVYSTQNNGTPSFQIISQPVGVYKENNSDTFLVSTTRGPPNNQDKIITITQPQMVPPDSERERLFECGECGKRFFKNGHLKSHMTIHTGSRPYVCSVCGKGFGRGTTLRKHEKTHLKRCKICDTTFSSKYELDLHLEMHRTYAFYK